MRRALPSIAATEIASAAVSQTPDQLAKGQAELDGLTTRFKQISAALIPLGEQGIEIGIVRGNLGESVAGFVTVSPARNSLRYLLLRTGTLALGLLLVLGVSELWRRAINRYVQDQRRRRQLLVLRRVVVSGAVVVALILGFITEFGSLATYAGFVTAGVAVALQNPILSVVGYFFLIGRYGFRVGDRVTISGVTGDVLDIGLVRIYLMELSGLGLDAHATGRVVVFANAVVFQPAALYKQMPGIDYVWHSVTLTLTGDSDAQLAENKLHEAVDSVYEVYRPKIEQEYSTLQQTVDIHLSVPRPESRMQYTDTGMQIQFVRYPVENGGTHPPRTTAYFNRYRTLLQGSRNSNSPQAADRGCRRPCETRKHSIMKLEELGVVGNCQFSALIHNSGDVVWCCLPRFDSEPVFSTLLDSQNGGSFRITAAGGETGALSYLPKTNIHETKVETSTGAVRVIDNAPRFLLYGRAFPAHSAGAHHRAH